MLFQKITDFITALTTLSTLIDQVQTKLTALDTFLGSTTP